MTDNRRILLVTGKPTKENLNLYASLDKNKETNAVVLHESHFSLVKTALPWVDLYKVPLEAKEFLSFSPKYVLKASALESFVASKYFVDALLISERLHPGVNGANEALNYVYEAVREANSILDSVGSTDIYFSNVPHSLLGYAIYGVAKLKGINTRMVISGSGFLMHKVYIADSIEDTIHDLIAKTESKKELELDWLSSKAIKQRKNHVVPNYLAAKGTKKNKHGGWKLYKKSPFRKYYNLGVLLYDFLKYEKSRSYIKSPEHLESFIYGKKYIYFGLHYQPEATTMPMAWVYASQYIILRTIIDALPDEVGIIVKEHPTMYKENRRDFYKYRPKIFYELIESSDNVFMVPVETSSELLINNALVVATATGTVGVEALANNVPILIFGNSSLRGAKGSFTCKDGCDVKLAVDIISGKNKEVVVTDDSLYQLAALYNNISYNAPENYYEAIDAYEDEATKNLKWHCLSQLLLK